MLIGFTKTIILSLVTTTSVITGTWTWVSSQHACVSLGGTSLLRSPLCFFTGRMSQSYSNCFKIFCLSLSQRGEMKVNRGWRNQTWCMTYMVLFLESAKEKGNFLSPARASLPKETWQVRGIACRVCVCGGGWRLRLTRKVCCSFFLSISDFFGMLNFPCILINIQISVSNLSFCCCVCQ